MQSVQRDCRGVRRCQQRFWFNISFKIPMGTDKFIAEIFITENV